MLQRSAGGIDGTSCDGLSPPVPHISRHHLFSERFSAFTHDFWTILSSAHINILLIFVPFAISSDLAGWSSTIVFTTSFLSLIPLAFLMSYSTRQASETVGSTVGGLFNITFSNVTELIVGIAALWNNEIELIQTTLLGSILSTLLFVFPISRVTLFLLGN